jgi:hypothetical protein
MERYEEKKLHQHAGESHWSAGNSHSLLTVPKQSENAAMVEAPK